MIEILCDIIDSIFFDRDNKIIRENTLKCAKTVSHYICRLLLQIIF